jgi:type IV pilus assembly protein PilV
MSKHMTLYRRLQAGLSMIEVLVSMTIVAFGVLGLLGLQARALSFQRDSFDRRTAAEMIAQLAERIRANHIGLVSGFYDRDLVPVGVAYDLNVATATPVAITPCAIPTACTERELASRDWVQWIAEYRRRSPGSAAYLQWDPGNTGFVTVSVAWPEPQSTGVDPLCPVINARLGVAIPANYRCYETAVFP